MNQLDRPLSDVPSIDAVRELLIAAAPTGEVGDVPYCSNPPGSFVATRVCLAAQAPDAEVHAVTESSGALRGLVVMRWPAWDREVFGFDVCRIEAFAACDVNAAQELAAWTDHRCQARLTTFCSARVPATNLREIAALEDVGFRFRETMFSPWTRLPLQSSGPAHECVRPGTAADMEELSAIAGSSFVADRFHQDPRFDPRSADELYRRWVNDWFVHDSRAKRSVVAEVGGVVAGAILYEIHESDVLIEGPVADATLVFVGERWRRRGVAKSLWSALSTELSSAGVAYATTGITAQNTSVFNLYVRMGFRFTSSAITLHRWYSQSSRERM